MFISRQNIGMKLLVKCSLAFLFLAQLGAVGFAQPDDLISVVAGNSTQGFSGDGGPATMAQINNPEGIAVDSMGNLYIADTANNRIRKVTPEGVISTIAGTGTGGFSGDGGSATSAQLASPVDVAVDSEGSLYIADFHNHRIRKITPEGVIHTVAGGGAEIPGDGGSATSAGLLYSLSIALDNAGNIYFSESLIFDGLPDRIRKVTPDGIISTVAGGGTEYPEAGVLATSADIDGVGGIAIDAAGNLYFTLGHRVLRVAPDGFISTVAGDGSEGYSGDGGSAASAQLHWPYGIEMDLQGNLYFAEVGNNCIRKVSADGIISTVLANLHGPFDIQLGPEGELYIAERDGNRILKLGNSASIVTTYFSQVAVGGGWTMTFTFNNTGSVEAFAELVLTDCQGNPLIVKGEVIDSYPPTEPPYSSSSFTLAIPSGGTIFLSTTAFDFENEIKTGWAKLSSAAASLTALATYEFAAGAGTQSMVSIPQSQLLQYATIPVDTNEREMKTMSYAIANPGSETISIKLALVDQDGILESDYVTLILGPGKQNARYLHQDMPGADMKGSLVLRAQNGGRFVAVGLSEKQGLLTALPVIAEKAPCVPD
jgi:hypothetical protein